MNEVNKTDIYKLPQKLRRTHVNFRKKESTLQEKKACKVRKVR